MDEPDDLFRPADWTFEKCENYVRAYRLLASSSIVAARTVLADSEQFLDFVWTSAEGTSDRVNQLPEAIQEDNDEVLRIARSAWSGMRSQLSS